MLFCVFQCLIYRTKERFKEIRMQAVGSHCCGTVVNFLMNETQAKSHVQYASSTKKGFTSWSKCS